MAEHVFKGELVTDDFNCVPPVNGDDLQPRNVTLKLHKSQFELLAGADSQLSLVMRAGYGSVLRFGYAGQERIALKLELDLQREGIVYIKLQDTLQDGLADDFIEAMTQYTEASDDQDLEGWLIKKGGGTSMFGRKSWKKRYFRLKNGRLSYAKDDVSEPVKVFEAPQVLGMVALAGGEAEFHVLDEAMLENASCEELDGDVVELATPHTRGEKPHKSLLVKPLGDVLTDDLTRWLRAFNPPAEESVEKQPVQQIPERKRRQSRRERTEETEREERKKEMQKQLDDISESSDDLMEESEHFKNNGPVADKLETVGNVWL